MAWAAYPKVYWFRASETTCAYASSMELRVISVKTCPPPVADEYFGRMSSKPWPFKWNFSVVVDMGALPVYKQLEKFHLKGQGFDDILPKYSSATGGGQVFTEITRNSMEEAYAQVVSEARNQYTLGYAAQAITSSAAYRDIAVTVDRKGLKVFAKDGYYPIPNIR